ncbi:MAG: ankyrin repeat domain-containing protein [Endozoicomonadaceae bacterium]|nr:ankyrin repeat domain-containing protein [Endozoicomonadaceae bacterium]
MNKNLRLLLILLPMFSISTLAGDLFSAIKERKVEDIFLLIANPDAINSKNVSGNTPLHEAIYTDFTQGALLLISSCFDMSATNNEEMTVLHTAALKNNVDILTYLLLYIKNINCQDKQGNTPLHIAAREGHIQCVKLLLVYKKEIAMIANPTAYTENDEPDAATLGYEDIDINMKNNAGKTALHLAASGGHYGCLMELLDAENIDTDAKDIVDCNALDYAIAAGHVNCIKLLLKFCSGQIKMFDKDGNTVLHKAVFANKPDSLRVLSEVCGSVFVNTQNRDGHTALWCAVTEGKDACLDILLKIPNINVNIKGNSHKVPIQIALENGNDIVIKKLLEAGANIYIKNQYCSTILHEAAFMGYTNCVALLLSFMKEDDINAVDYHNNTALHIAAFRGNTECVRMLSQLPFIHFNVLSNCGKTALHRAVDGNHPECVQILTEAGADVNIIDNLTSTPLYIAAIKGHPKCIEKLLKSPHIDINAKNCDDKTALYIAALRGHVECIRILLQSPSVKLDVVNAYHSTPLHCAVSKNHLECVKLLAKAGANTYIKNIDGHSAIHTAISKGFTECATILKNRESACARGALNKFSNMHLYEAAKKGDVAHITELLRSLSIDEIRVTDSIGNNALHMAAFKGHAECVSRLTQFGFIDVNTRDFYGKTALHSAVDGNHPACIKVLIEAGADTNISNTIDSSTALHSAVRRNYVKCVTVLLPAMNDAGINAVNDYGSCVLIIAAVNRYPECIAALLKSDHIMLNKKDKDGNTALICAINKVERRCIDLLLKAGADVNAKNDFGINALHSAVGKYSEYVELLLQHMDIDQINSTTHKGDTALHKACFVGDLHSVIKLIQYGADVCSKNHRRSTILHMATAGGHLVVVQYLLYNIPSIDINDKNCYGDTALHVAGYNGDEEIFSLLIGAGANIHVRNNKGELP